jgi:uncharacterized protein
MSRFAGYVGIANFMGARFVGNEAAVSLVMREAGARGLLYFDDGSAPRSPASRVAGAQNVSFAKADIVVDAVNAASDIDGALARLEALARERGSAVGYANAVPAVVERVAKWAKAAAGRGVVLVPLTIIANKPKST